MQQESSAPPHASATRSSLASLTDLSTFRFTRLLRSDNDVAHLLGTFPPDPAPAILTLRATKLSSHLIDDFVSTLSSDAVSSNSPLSTPPRLALRHVNDIYHSFTATHSALPSHVDIIHPATEQHITQLSVQQPDVLVVETPHLYRTVHLPYIERQLSQPSHLAWLSHILDGSSEAERVLGRTDEWVAVAQPEWDMRSLDTLHALVIPQARGLTSLRALNAAHLPLFAAMREGVVRALGDRCGVKSATELLMFVHYPPSFYHLHVHVVHVSAGASLTSSVNRAVDVFDIEQQLQRDGRWYEQCSIRCRVRDGHALAATAQQQQAEQVSLRALSTSAL